MSLGISIYLMGVAVMMGVRALLALTSPTLKDDLEKMDWRRKLAIDLVTTILPSLVWPVWVLILITKRMKYEHENI